jgi:DNA-directed RNA polymerase subunit RPC12/RpoP
VVPVRGKTIGIIVIIVGIALAIVPALVMMPNLLNGSLTGGGFMICEGPAVLIGLIVAGVGVFLMMSGKKEAAEQIEVEKEKLILNMIETRGKVRLTDIAIEMNVPTDRVSAYIYDLVGKKLFVGYVDWKGGILQSQQAKDMPEHNCPNCGGQVELAGKGIIKCPYCGSEIFLQP